MSAMVTNGKAHAGSEPLISMALWLPDVAKMAIKPSLAPLQKHSLGGCTISMPTSTDIGKGVALFHCTLPYCYTFSF